MDYAGANGHCSVASWLRTNRPEGCTAETINLAAKKDHVEAVKYLYEHCGLRCSEAAVKEAAKSNYVAVAWVLKHNPSFADFKHEPSRHY